MPPSLFAQPGHLPRLLASARREADYLQAQLDWRSHGDRHALLHRTAPITGDRRGLPRRVPTAQRKHGRCNNRVPDRHNIADILRYQYYNADMPLNRPRPYSPYAVDAARLLGAEIRLARRKRRWSQTELAERVGINPRTVYKIERGDLSVGLGAAFEAAALLGVPLFYADRSRLTADLDRVEARAALLPRPGRVRSDQTAIDDF